MEVMVSTVLRALYHWERLTCRYFIGEWVGIRHEYTGYVIIISRLVDERR
jgi:hypothetical protein